MLIGPHVSIQGGLIMAAMEAVSYGADTFMIYTGASQNSKRQATEKLKIAEGKAYMAEHGIKSFVVHAPYIINLATYKDDSFRFATEFLREELVRTDALGAEYLVVHPGAYTGRDLDYGIKRIAEALNIVLDAGSKAFICLELMSGKGTEIGRNFEEMAAIIDLVKLRDRVKVCFDTCHAHDGGYDIVNGFDKVMNDFDRILGVDLLKVFHINGSLNERSSKKDRHANIIPNNESRGPDKIGFDALYKIAHSKYAEGKPLILETPWLDNTRNLYKQEIEALRG